MKKAKENEAPVITMARKNAIRSINKRFGCPRMLEPMVPGSYTVEFRVNEDTVTTPFPIHPGDTYEILAQLCEGFCIGMDDERGLVQDIGYSEPAGELAMEIKDIYRNGMVLQAEKADSMFQGNIFLTPKRIREIVCLAGKTAYKRPIPFSAVAIDNLL